MNGPPAQLVVLLSGSGSNLQAILDRIEDGTLNARVLTAISDRAGAHGLERARRGGVETRVLEAAGFEHREAYDEALHEMIGAQAPELVVLAGFMRILSPVMVGAFTGRMINLHPSLLPRYRGLDTYRRVLASGDPVHGTSVHFVSDELDGGPLIAQAQVPVRAADDEESLSARVQHCEHILYPRVIEWFVDGRVRLVENQVVLDGQTLTRPVIFTANELATDGK